MTIDCLLFSHKTLESVRDDLRVLRGLANLLNRTFAERCGQVQKGVERRGHNRCQQTSSAQSRRFAQTRIIAHLSASCACYMSMQITGNWRGRGASGCLALLTPVSTHVHRCASMRNCPHVFSKIQNLFSKITNILDSAEHLNRLIIREALQLL